MAATIPSQALLATFAGIFVLQYAIIRQVPDSNLPNLVSTRPLTFSFWSAILVTYINRCLIWPYFRSPLNKFPTIDRTIESIWSTLESPRGRIPLRWIEERPEVDILHVRTGLLGISLLIPISPEGFKDIMGPAAYALEKPLGIRKALATTLGWGLVTVEGEEHKRQRKALTPAFNIGNIRGLYPLMWQKAEEFSTRVKTVADKNGFVEIGEWASYLTLDIIGHAALSQDFRTMSEPDSDVSKAFKFIMAVSPGRTLLFVANLLLPHTLLTNLPLPIIHEARKQNRILRQACANILASKKKDLKNGSKQDETDMLGDVIASGAFSDNDVIDQMLTFLAAGHETTASALTWCCYAMAQHPDVQDKLYQELRDGLPTSDVDHTTFDKLPYLNGVCEEVARLFPTVPSTVRVVREDTVICNVAVPAGTIISIIPYAVNRNPRFWGVDAAEFKPERWIDVASDGSQRINKHGGSDSNLCGMTFLHGNRSCIGMNFAKAEIRCAVASLFSKYEVSMWNPKEKVKSIGSVTSRPDVGMKVKLKSR